MRRILLPLLLVVLLSSSVQAETYKISGRATYADDTPVALQYIAVECEQGAIDCYHYRGTTAITDAYGYFTVLFEAEDEDDNVEIQLSLRGETFNHTIDIKKYQNSSNDRVFQDLQLQQNPPPSGVMMGLGETKEEIVQVLKDLREHGVTMLTLGQYLAPSRHHLPVERYVPPSEFDELKEIALELGFTHAACGPFVRSSYHADLQAQGMEIK